MRLIRPGGAGGVAQQAGHLGAAGGALLGGI